MKFVQITMVALGFLLLGFLVGQLGYDEVLHQLDAIKWTFVGNFGGGRKAGG